MALTGVTHMAGPGGSSAYVSGGSTINVIPKGTGAAQLADSSITDNGTVVSTTEIIQTADGAVGAPAYSFTGATGLGFWRVNASSIAVALGGNNILGFQSGGVNLQSGGAFQFTNSSTNAFGTPDTFLTRGGAAATLQLGAASAAAPVAQTLRFQGARGGTDSNTNAVDATIQGSLGTGTGTAGNLIFKTGVVQASGTTAHVATTALTLDGSQGATVAGALSTGAAGFTVSSAGLPTKSNSITTAGQGFPVIVSITSQRSESAADANVLTFTPPAAVGAYRIAFVMDVSAANTATLGWTATWKNSNGAAIAPTNLALTKFGVAAPALTFAAAANDSYYGECDITVDNSATAIVVKLTFAGTSFTAKVSAWIERVI